MTDSSFTIDRQRCQDLDGARRLEWMVSNGRGGFAMATVTGLLTRRYHGLLVAAIRPPVERFVLLAKIDATIMIDGLTYELGTNDYPEAVHPRGYKFLDSFSLRPIPVWRWRLGDALLEQRLCMAPGEDTSYIQFRLLSGPKTVRIAARPLCTSRHFHTLTRYRDMGPPVAEADADGISFRWAGDRPGWFLSHNGDYRPKPDWYYDFVLTGEAERGQESLQDLFVPGVVSKTIASDDPVGLVFAASTRPSPWREAPDALDAAGAADPSSDDMKPAPVDAAIPLLVRMGADFIVARADESKTIVAGYPWFGDWGRDTFISLTGLCLVSDRFDDARSIIQGYAQFVDGGMIPNRFPPFGEDPAYNTADATLWYIHAIDRYLTYSGDWTFIADVMYPVVADIIEAHIAGTRHNIRRTDDGLLQAGSAGLQMTWMDAKVGDHVITPRVGKPVEINALWFNALAIAAGFAERLGDRTRASRWLAGAERCRSAFNARFWNADEDCLLDVVDVDHAPGAVDASIRPNQLFAVSLTHPVLNRDKWIPTVRVCEQRLWTPLGMRTLAPEDPRYCPQFRGDLAARDGAYHQGTVWPWLLGPFVTAYTRSYPDADPPTVGRFLVGIQRHLTTAGLGGISEVADGAAPHAPGGCPWQAWSVAEPLRALCEDVLRTHPKAARDQTRSPTPIGETAGR